MTINDDIFNASVRHQVAVNVAGGDTGKRAIAELNEFDQNLLAAITRFDPGDTNRGRDAVIRRIEESEREVTTGLFDLILADMIMIAEEEEDFNELLLLPLLLARGVELNKPRLADIRRDVRQTEFTGALLKLGTARDHLEEFARRRTDRLVSEVKLARLGGLSSGQVVRNLRGTRGQRFRNGAFAQMRRDLNSIALGGVIHSSNVAAGAFAEANKATFREVWIAVLDGKTCAICASRHNRKFPVGVGPQPPAHANCRCYRLKVVPGESFKSLSFDEWLREQPRNVVEQVLGKSRARMFLEGGLEIKRFVENPFRKTPTSRILTLDELRASNSEAVREALRKAGLVG
jgi:hypothetical protein